MYGLIMLRKYLDEILDGTKTNDARIFDTKKRGTIALVDTKRSEIVGLVDLISTHAISAIEFYEWHNISISEQANIDIEQLYWSYDFVNPRRLAFPIKIQKNNKTWLYIEKEKERQFVIRNSLF